MKRSSVLLNDDAICGASSESLYPAQSSIRFWASFRTIDGGSDDDRFFGPPRRPTGTSNGVKSRVARGASSGSRSRSYWGSDGMNSLPTASISMQSMSGTNLSKVSGSTPSKRGTALISPRTNSRMTASRERPKSSAENCSNRQLVTAQAVVMRDTLVSVSCPTGRPCTPSLPVPVQAAAPTVQRAAAARGETTATAADEDEEQDQDQDQDQDEGEEQGEEQEREQDGAARALRATVLEAGGVGGQRGRAVCACVVVVDVASLPPWKLVCMATGAVHS